MNDLASISFDKLSKVYRKYFTLGYLNTELDNKLALIALICNVTAMVKKKNPKVTCYDIICKIGHDFPQLEKDTFFKSLGAICADLMYGCEHYPDFGIKPENMPKQIKALLNSYCPF